jgi:hypothetical protein
LYRQDQIWKLICKELKWEAIPTTNSMWRHQVCPSDLSESW